jgi:nitroreductase
MNVQDAIHNKRAVRQFLPDPLPDEIERAILRAGRRAQSSKNSQPWRFVAITRRETLKQLSTMGKYAGHLAGAALGVVILTPDPASHFSVMFDAGQVAAYMQLAAWELGVGSCLATIYEPEQVCTLLGFPQEWHARIALSFGYPSDPSALTRPLEGSGRQPLDELVHWEGW